MTLPVFDEIDDLGDRIAAACATATPTVVPDQRPDVPLEARHVFKLAGLCPVSGNPQVGSTLTIVYTPAGRMLEVISLRRYVESFRGGRRFGDVWVRDMEHVVQRIADDCHRATRVPVTVLAKLRLKPEQKMRLRAKAGE